MNTGAKIAVAVVGGYLLGRTKKLKMAVVLGGLLAGKRLASDPGQLLKQIGEYVDSNPELAKLSEQVQSRLVDAGKTAAVAAASNRLDKMSDAIQERTEQLQSVPLGDEDSDEEPSDEAPSDEEPSDEEPEDQAEEEPQRPRNRAKKSTSSTTSGGTKAPAKKAAKKTAKKSAPAKKSASSGSRGGRSRSSGNKG